MLLFSFRVGLLFLLEGAVSGQLHQRSCFSPTEDGSLHVTGACAMAMLLHLSLQHSQANLRRVCGGRRGPGRSFELLNGVSQSIGTAPLLPCHFPAGISSSTLTFTLHSPAGGKRETFRGWLPLSLSLSSKGIQLELQVDLPGCYI